MEKSQETSLTRRTVLQGAAALAGTGALGMSPVSGLANVLKTNGEKAETLPVTFYYWNEDQLVPATNMLTSDKSLRHVKVTLHEPVPTNFLSHVDLLTQIQTEEGTVSLPHFFWTAGGNSHSVQAHQYVAEGLSMSLHQGEASSQVTIGNSTLFGIKLNVGTYILAPNSSRLNGAVLSERRNMPVLMKGEDEVTEPYLVLTIEKID